MDADLKARVYGIVADIPRAPYKGLISKQMQAKVKNVENCTNCGACKTRCPYGLDTPTLARKQYELYKEFVAAHANEVE